jgi:predicted esterase
VLANLGGRQEQTDVQMASPDQLMTMIVPDKPRVKPDMSSASPEHIQPLASEDATALKVELTKYFTANTEGQAKWKFVDNLEQLLARNEAGVRAVAWEAFRDERIHSELKTNFDAKVVTFREHKSPYAVKQVGERPAKGWALFIAMHGGGGASKELNDSQWRHMQIYYKDHPEAGGYLYVALRAPNDTWNGFYDNYVYPLIDNLILQFQLFGNIDPDKVFIMGYSHGGYGAYAIGPKMPDRFAKIHASAAAATDGETTAKTLRTTKFTAMVGELDTAYKRYERNLRFKKEVETLRGDRTDIYPVTVTVIPGNGHTGLPDRDLIKDMYPAVRNPVPHEISWLQTDPVVKDLFWLHTPSPGKNQEIIASCHDNRFVVTANELVTDISVLMDSRLVDFSKPVSIELNGMTVTRNLASSLKTFCETLARRGDPEYAFSAALEIGKDQSGQLRLK